jgi:two-component system response regulator PrrA
MHGNVLVVDDDIAICEALERNLRNEGFTVRVSHNGEDAILAIEQETPDLLVLDINMPKMNGIEVTKYLRKEQNMLPICILSAKDEVTDRVLGLESGADDYLIKPFAFSELLARINALLRREHPTSSKIIKLNHLTIDPQSRIATYSDKPLNLTKIEFDLLTVLADHTNFVLTRNQLLELVWGYDFEAETNVVDVFIGYLRKKLEIDESPRIIYTVRGVGFVLRS